MKKEHPWIPESEMLSRVKKLGYTGGVTMMGNYMRGIRPIIIQELHTMKLLTSKVNNILSGESGIAKEVILKVIKNLVKDNFIKPEDIILPEDLKDSKNWKWLKLLDTTETSSFWEATTEKQSTNLDPTLKNIDLLHTPNSNGNGYIKIEAYKVGEDGTLFEFENEAKGHVEALARNKIIDQFIDPLPNKISKEQLRDLLKRFAEI
jgi:hypothetical protein